MFHLLATAYGEDVYNNSAVYASTTELADSGAGSGGLADTGMFAAFFIAVGVAIIAVTMFAQFRRRQAQYSV